MRNRVCGQRRQTSIVVMSPMAEQVVLVLIRNPGDMFVSFNLRSRGCQKIDVHCVPIITSTERSKVGRYMSTVRGGYRERMGRRHVGRADDGTGSRPWHVVLAGRRHHLRLGSKAWVRAILETGKRRGGSHLMSLLIPAGIRIVVYPGVASQLVGPAEALATSRKLAGMRLLAGVRTDVTGLMLKTMERSIAERAFVGPRKVLSVFRVAYVRAHRSRHQADGSSHVGISQGVRGDKVLEGWSRGVRRWYRRCGRV